MNSHIFDTHQSSNSNLKHNACLTVGSSPAVQWLTAFLFIVAVILFPERPAWGDDLNLHVGSNGIKGYAHQVALEDVLEVLADKGGYTFYLDEALINAAITFNIPHAMPAEKAFQRILSPYSYALVYVQMPEHRVKIEQIQVYYENPDAVDSDLGSEKPAEATDDEQDQEMPQQIAMAVAYGQ
ncbi:MAG: hypothetical protein PVH87_14895 [Desulfobacteraceae bacterium]|jgi:hypothetical protein